MHGIDGVTDSRHLEIIEYLENEDVHPGEWYNEFGENKTIVNPKR